MRTALPPRARGFEACELLELAPTCSPTGDFLPAITVDSLDLARRIAAATPAILPAVRGMVAEDLRDGHLVPLDFHEPWMRTAYALLLRRDRTLSPAASAFVETLLAVEAEIAADSAEHPATVRGDGAIIAPDARSH